MFSFHGDPDLYILFEKLTGRIGACLDLGTLLRFEALGDLRVNIIKCSDWHQVTEAFPLENGQKLVDSQLKHNMGDYQDFSNVWLFLGHSLMIIK